MNDPLNRKVHNYLSRLISYFERPQIFDDKAMATEAQALMFELDKDRKGEACDSKS